MSGIKKTGRLSPMSVTISVNEIERVAAETVQQPGIEDAHTSHCLDMVNLPGRLGTGYD